MRCLFVCAWLGCLVCTALAAGQLAAEPSLNSHFVVPDAYQGDHGALRSPLHFVDGRPIKTVDDWRQRREEIRRQWLERLGGWPELLSQPQLKYLAREQRGEVMQHHVHVEIAPGGKWADGYLLVPPGEGPFPAVFVPFYEPLTSIGRGKPDTLGSIDFGWQLTQRGFVTLSIGTPGSIESPGKDTRDLLIAIAEERNCQPLGYLAYVSANCHTALAGLPNVDRRRIGMVGHSYGGKWTMFSTCLYDKYACAVWCDPGIVFDEGNSSINYWEPWYIGYDPGRQRQRGVPSATNPRTGPYERLFDSGGHEMVELHALMAPRSVLVSGGSEDPPRRWRALNHLIDVNRLLGLDQRVGMTNRQGHRPTPDAAAVIYRFFEERLRDAK